jgi:hypothetical protein
LSCTLRKAKELGAAAKVDTKPRAYGSLERMNVKKLIRNLSLKLMLAFVLLVQALQRRGRASNA